MRRFSLKTFCLNLSVKNKILLSFYIVAILISLILGIYSYYVSEKYILNRVSAANAGIVRQINSSLIYLQEDIFDISTYLCFDPGVRDLLEKQSEDMTTTTRNIDHTLTNPQAFMINLLSTRSNISCIILYSKSGLPLNFLSTDTSTGVNMISSVAEIEIYETARALNGKPVWVPINDDNKIFIQNNNYPKVAMSRIIKDDTYNDVGFIVIGVNEKVIKKVYKENVDANNESLIVIDSKGRIISSVGPDFFSDTNERQKYFSISENNEGVTVEKISGKKMLISYSSNNPAGWKILYTIPMDTITREINSIKLFTVGVIFTCLIISLPLIIMISSFITAPIKELLRSMKNFQKGNFNEKIEIKYGDEIGKLGVGYNDMVADIKKLIDKTYILQIKEREAELNALQAQINPHFLYNTLDTVFWKATACDDKEISEILYSLSKFFRLSLNRGKGYTTVSQEKEIVEHYLILQKKRFKSKLNYTLKIDSAILSYNTPKLILQPLVENAIIHGIEQKEEGGSVTITGSFIKSERLCFVIEDDGIGMNEDTIKNIFKNGNNINQDSSIVSGGYAVKNIYERLKLYFNNNFSLKYTSKPGSGTKVIIEIPALKQIGDFNDDETSNSR